MFQTTYIIWFLLPLVLGILTVRAVFHTSKKASEREYPKDLLPQFLYCLVVFGIAVLIDKTAYEPAMEYLEIDETNSLIVRWLLYPGLLLLLAQFQSIFDKKKDAKEKERRRANRMKYAAR